MNQFEPIQTMILFDTAEGAETSALHYRGDCEVENHALHISPGHTVSFDTYFNLFPIKQLHKYTTVQRITVAITLSGKGRVELYQTDVNNNECLLSSAQYASEQPEQVCMLDDTTMEASPEYCYFRIISESDTFIYEGGLYTREAPRMEPKVACCFCTFKREKEVIGNIEAIVCEVIENSKSVLYQHADVYVSDNGHTLPKEVFQNNRVHLFNNKNFGGSAGFTRCMIEARFGKEKDDFTHIILMDDDARIRPYVVERTAELLRYIRPEYMSSVVGGAMLSLQEPTVQLENGSVWNGFSNKLIGYDLDLCEKQNILRNQEQHADYNAWFYACIPADFITEDNLPLPLFIHGDDINYGLRGKGDVIRMNGICIWHPNPTVKTRPYMEYYNARNYKIVNVGYSASISPGAAFRAEMKSILSCALSYRYEEADYRIWGCRDFFKGIDWLKTLDAEKNNMTVLRWKDYPKADAENKEEFSFSEPLDRKMDKKRIILNWFCPTRTGTRLYPDDVAWNKLDLFRVRECMILNRETGKGVVLRKDYKELRRIVGELFRLSAEFRKRYRSVSREWEDRIGELESISFWKGYLDL